LLREVATLKAEGQNIQRFCEALTLVPEKIQFSEYKATAYLSNIKPYQIPQQVSKVISLWLIRTM